MSMSLSRRARTAVASIVVAGGLVAASPVADAAPATSAVYVLSNQTSGNQVLVFARDSDGTLAASTRPLSGSGTAPAQVSFTADGDHLLVTERATQRIGVYAVDDAGLATGPTVVSSSGVTPFGFGFDNKGHVIVSEAFAGAADASAVSSYSDHVQGAGHRPAPCARPLVRVRTGHGSTSIAV